jgi:hypothetical protein
MHDTNAFQMTELSEAWDKLQNIKCLCLIICTECPTSYRTRHFFDNFTTNEDIATKFEADSPHCVRNVTTS